MPSLAYLYYILPLKGYSGRFTVSVTYRMHCIQFSHIYLWLAYRMVPSYFLIYGGNMALVMNNVHVQDSYVDASRSIQMANSYFISPDYLVVKTCTVAMFDHFNHIVVTAFPKLLLTSFPLMASVQ